MSNKITKKMTNNLIIINLGHFFKIKAKNKSFAKNFKEKLKK